MCAGPPRRWSYCGSIALSVRLLFCAWLAWFGYRVVIPVWDQMLTTLIACLDATVRRFDGVRTYAWTDNPRSASIDHVAGMAVLHPQIVETARH